MTSISLISYGFNRGTESALKSKKVAPTRFPKILPGEVFYTSLRARKACLELGILTNHQTRSINRECNIKKSDTSLTSQLENIRFLRHSEFHLCRHKPKKKRQRAVATIVIGRLPSDYVTNQSTIRLPPIHTSSHDVTHHNFTRMVTKTEVKENLNPDKPNNTKKRVTFNDDITIEEYSPRRAIVEKKTNKQKNDCDITMENKTNNTKQNKRTKAAQGSDGRDCDETKVECDVTEENVKNKHDKTTIKSLDSVKDSPVTSPLDSTITNLTTLETGSELRINARSGETLISGGRLSEKESDYQQTCLKIGVAEVGALHSPTVEEYSDTVAQIPSGEEDDKEETGEENMKSTDDEMNADNSSASTALADSQKIQDSIPEQPAGGNSDIYKRKNLKKRYALLSGCLPAIREELSSRPCDEIIPDNDIAGNDVVTMSSKTADWKESHQAETKKRLPQKTDFTRHEVLLKAREDARISALKGQLAAEKAAWNCVIRYPRHVTSQIISSTSSSEDSYDVIKGARFRPQQEKTDTFSFNRGQKLSIYKHNFGSKYRATNNPNALPPLHTSSASDVTLVTRRHSGVWVPDMSVVTETRRKIKSKTRMR